MCLLLIRAMERQLPGICCCDRHVVYCRLASIGAAGVAERFAAAEVDLSVLPHLNEHDLEVSARQEDCCWRQA